MTNFKTTAALLAAGLLAATAAQASSPAARAKPPVAKVSLTQARTIALHAAPGKLIKSEYEKEGGGWRYSFDIKQGPFPGDWRRCNDRQDYREQVRSEARPRLSLIGFDEDPPRRRRS